MGLSNISILTVTYGDYWSRYGESWLETVAEADPQPAKVVLVSDVPVDVPQWVTLIVAGEGLYVSDYVNIGVGEIDSEWLFSFGVDDLLLPGALESLTVDTDAYVWPLFYGGNMKGQIDYLGGYDECYLLRYNTMRVYAMHRTSLMREIPYRRIHYHDDAHWAEMAYFGKTVTFSDTPRAVWVRHDDALSFTNNPDWQREVNDFKDRLAAGLVIAGLPE